jgi:hypothetical protein
VPFDVVLAAQPTVMLIGAQHLDDAESRRRMASVSLDLNA